jgi:1-acyl-sn-glycerol-3-phosphate acyltransferase
MRFNRAVALSTAAVVLPVAYIGYKYRGRASTDVAFHEGAAVNVHAPSQPLERALHALGRRVVISVTTSLSTFLLPLRSTVEVHNLDRLHRFADRPRADGAPLITVANHHSVLDDPAMMSFIAPTAADKLRWSICTEEICFQDAFPATWFALGKALPVRRGASIYQKGLAALQDRANAGDWVHVFAEARTWQEGGTPQRDAKGRWCSASGRCGPPGATLGPLKWGVGKVVANAARAPVVVPVFHTGMAGVAPQNAQNDVMGWDLFTRHSIDIRVGEPVPVTDLLEGYHAAACERAEARNEERARRLRAARGWAGWLAGWRAPPETAAASAAADAAAAALAAALRAAALPDSHPALAPRALRAAARARALEMELRRAAPADAPPPQPLGADPRAKGMLRRFAQLESLLRPTPAGGVGDPALHYGPHRVATRMLRSGLVVPAYTEPPLRAQPPDQALLGPEDALEEEALRLELYGAIAQRIGDSLAALEQEAKRARLAAGKQ